MENIDAEIENKSIERIDEEIVDAKAATVQTKPVKIKKPRSEAQIKAFEKAKLKRQENFEKRKALKEDKEKTVINEIPVRDPPAPIYGVQQQQLPPATATTPAPFDWRQAPPPQPIINNYYYGQQTSNKPSKKVKKKVVIQSSDSDSDASESEEEEVYIEPTSSKSNPLFFSYT